MRQMERVPAMAQVDEAALLEMQQQSSMSCCRIDNVALGIFPEGSALRRGALTCESTRVSRHLLCPLFPSRTPPCESTRVSRHFPCAIREVRVICCSELPHAWPDVRCVCM